MFLITYHDLDCKRTVVYSSVDEFMQQYNYNHIATNPYFQVDEVIIDGVPIVADGKILKRYNYYN